MLVKHRINMFSPRYRAFWVAACALFLYYISLNSNDPQTRLSCPHAKVSPNSVAQSSWSAPFSDFACTHTVAGLSCKKQSGNNITCRQDAHPQPMCTFKNVCLSPTGTLLYFVDPRATVSMLPPSRIEMGANGVILYTNITYGEPSSLPKDNLAMLTQHYPRNWGHALLDEVLPLFLMLYGLGFPVDASTLVATDTPPQYRSPYELLVPKENIRDLAQVYGGCFAQFGVGIPELLYSRKGFKSMEIGLKLFRSHVLSRYHIQTPCRRKFSVLFVDKDPDKSDHAARWLNIHESAEQARSRHPDWNVTVARWTNVSLTQQLHLIQESHVLVSLPGSDVVSGLFLQEHSGIIMPCRHYNKGFEWSNEFPLMFDFLPHITAVQFCDDIVQVAQPNQVNVDVPFLLGLLEHFHSKLFLSRKLHC